MSIIKQMKEEHIPAMARLMRNAYPGYDITVDAQKNTEKWVKRMVTSTTDEIGLGYFDEYDQLLGGIQVLQQSMNLRMEQVDVIGLGGLCVDLLHKKKRIALNLLLHAFLKGRNDGACMAILDPFNIGFYKKMGCGISVKNHQFKLKPSQISKVGDRSLVSELTEKHMPEVVEFVHEYFEKNHGMLKMEAYEVWDILKECQMTLGVWQQNKLSGIMPIRFERTAPHNIFKTNLIVEAFLWDNYETAKALMAFLNAQEDQVHQVIIFSQDNNFEFNFQNPDTGDDDTFHTRSNEMYRTGNGMMARILNVEKALAVVEVPDHESQYFPIHVYIDDPLIDELTGLWTLERVAGKISASPAKEHSQKDGSVDIANMASLVMGAVEMDSLLNYGLIEVNDNTKMRALGRVLHAAKAPVCLSRF